MKEKTEGIAINQEEIYSYLKDIRRIKVMTPERERDLSKMMSSGRLTRQQQEEIEKELNVFFFLLTEGCSRIDHWISQLNNNNI